MRVMKARARRGKGKGGGRHPYAGVGAVLPLDIAMGRSMCLKSWQHGVLEPFPAVWCILELLALDGMDRENDV